MLTEVVNTSFSVEFLVFSTTIDCMLVYDWLWNEIKEHSLIFCQEERLQFFNFEQFSYDRWNINEVIYFCYSFLYLLSFWIPTACINKLKSMILYSSLFLSHEFNGLIFFPRFHICIHYWYFFGDMMNLPSVEFEDLGNNLHVLLKLGQRDHQKTTNKNKYMK